jgi:hypothetical protein
MSRTPIPFPARVQEPTAEPELSPLPEAILRLAARGWPLFPCTRRRKQPLISSWPRLASCDPCVLVRWAEEHPGCNWAAVTGPQSGLVLDIDGPAGRASLATLESKHGPLSRTLTVITGREDGGEQRWFRYPVGHDIRNSTAKLGAGLDVRGAGGYAMIPPSIHPTGRVYMFVDETVPMAEPTEWLLELLLAPDTGDTNGFQQAILQRSILRNHERNDGLTRYAGALRRRGADLAELQQKLEEANQRRCQPSLGDREVRRIAVSVARYPVGGPDPLERAWQQIAGKIYSSNEEKFLALCRHLQKARPDQDIALPLQRIGNLMGIHWTSAQTYRRNAVQRGILTPTAEYVARKRAGRYAYNEAKKGRKGPCGPPPCTSGTRTREKTLTSGLVRIANPPSTNGSASSEILPRACY